MRLRIRYCALRGLASLSHSQLGLTLINTYTFDFIDFSSFLRVYLKQIFLWKPWKSNCRWKIELWWFLVRPVNIFEFLRGYKKPKRILCGGEFEKIVILNFCADLFEVLNCKFRLLVVDLKFLYAYRFLLIWVSYDDEVSLNEDWG